MAARLGSHLLTLPARGSSQLSVLRDGLMTQNILALPLTLFSLVFGGVIAYSLFHIDTVADVDLERLKVGQHIVLRKKVGAVDYEATIYVKVGDPAVGELGVIQLNGIVEGVGSNIGGQPVDFVSTDSDCVGTNFQIINWKSHADLIIQPGGVPRACHMYGYLKDNRTLTRVDQ